ncbi:arrestin domain-containing protein 3 [Polypterus senegalus]
MVLGKVKSFTVSYDCLNDSNVPVYSSGDSVSGRVIIEVTGEIRVKSLCIHAKGFAKVRWTESRNAGSNTAYTQNYTEEVEYLNHKSILIGHERDDDNSEEGHTTIHSGRHEYAFSFELPQTPLATSFEGKHGSVRYWVKAELYRPWLPLPMKIKKEFTVFEHIDINTPSLLSPQAGTKEKTLCCWFCTSGPISLSAKIERKGYTPGESIQMFAEIENCSSRMVVPKAAIYQTQTFYAKGKMKEVKQLVANLRGESLSSGKTETWNGKMLKIPPVSPSILDCTIIRVEYSLMVYVDIPGAMNLFLNLPLVIGTIPLHPFGSRTSSVSSQCSMNMNSWLHIALPDRPEAPPSYAEIITDEQRQNTVASSTARDDFDRAFEGPLFAYIQEFRYQPPPLYSEIDPNPDQVNENEEGRPDTCPSR